MPEVDVFPLGRPVVRPLRVGGVRLRTRTERVPRFPLTRQVGGGKAVPWFNPRMSRMSCPACGGKMGLIEATFQNRTRFLKRNPAFETGGRTIFSSRRMRVRFFAAMPRILMHACPACARIAGVGHVFPGRYILLSVLCGVVAA